MFPSPRCPLALVSISSAMQTPVHGTQHTIHRALLTNETYIGGNSISKILALVPYLHLLDQGQNASQLTHQSSLYAPPLIHKHIEQFPNPKSNKCTTSTAGTTNSTRQISKALRKRPHSSLSVGQEQSTRRWTYAFLAGIGILALPACTVCKPLCMRVSDVSETSIAQKKCTAAG